MTTRFNPAMPGKTPCESAHWKARLDLSFSDGKGPADPRYVQQTGMRRYHCPVSVDTTPSACGINEFRFLGVGC